MRSMASRIDVLEKNLQDEPSEFELVTMLLSRKSLMKFSSWMTMGGKGDRHANKEGTRTDGGIVTPSVAIPGNGPRTTVLNSEVADRA